MARKAETGVSKSALTDFTTGTSVASRARRENCLKSGCSMAFDQDRGHGAAASTKWAVHQTAGFSL